MCKSLAAAVVLFFLAGCASKDASTDRPHATVTMRDGTRLTGSVTSSSASSITLAGDDNVTRTLDMKQVRSIEYDDSTQAGAAPPAGGAPPANPSQAQASHPDHYHPPQTAIVTKTYQLAAGTRLPVRAESTIDSARAVPGQLYPAEVTQNILDADGAVVIPAGSNAQIVIVSASQGGKIKGASDLVLDLRSVSVEGQEYQLSTVDLERRGTNGVGANRRTAKFAGGGSAIGAIIGAIAGGGKGAAIGAGAGAGAGALTQIATKGPAIRIPVETILTFQLDRPLRVTASN